MTARTYLSVAILLLVFFDVSVYSAVAVSNGTEEAGAVYEIPGCTQDQLNLGEAILTTEPSTLLCEKKVDIKSGMMLQSADAAGEFCAEQICLNALQTLFSTLPNCRYELWGLKYSAAKFLNHCGFATDIAY
ncbi:hypothetical protein GN244_ATG03682 [Phytophthora infestans]|uniref:Elicitin-like protein n=1 Tax=Phytophthora infestans TaxID=4787 RepID=A0A833TNN2_PHYIN|nr:hypothetical protein GN244_ATG03682 [Phytophthora infestans]KAF4127626.1 hypothetical protein GN958_ATG23199 [Phytophthora infestans]KAF4141596.1 hypothetical protein GN958_ATG09215 [Phytophthora infestans]KAI9995765.1 hypothetical protein PInf_012833 [Phytophthora infestans]